MRDLAVAMLVTLLPVGAAGFLGLALFYRDYRGESVPRWAWALSFLLIGVLASNSVSGLRDEFRARGTAGSDQQLVGRSVGSAGSEAPQRLSAANAGSAGTAGIAGAETAASVSPISAMGPKSREEYLASDGTIAKIHDPRVVAGGAVGATEGQPVQPDWQTALIGSMVDAIKLGEKQVVIVFSRQGCPWCDKQVLVLHEALRRRASVGGSTLAGSPAEQALRALEEKPVLLPIRVFVLDADEFPTLMQNFKVEAFPTVGIFGRPYVAPFFAPGFLDEATLEQLLAAIAVARPEGEATAPRRQGPVGRLRSLVR